MTALDKNMRRFISGLSKFAGVCRSDITDMRYQEKTLDKSFRALQLNVKRKIMGATKPQTRNKPYISPLEMRQRLHPDERKLPLPPLEDRVTQSADDSQLRPMPFPLRHYALRAQPCRAATRLYRPRAKQTLEEERFEMIDEYVKYPSQEGALMLDGRIDPVLHVGVFNKNEFKWNGKIPTQVL